MGLFGYSQVTNNFQNGNWVYYSNHCWGIGPNGSYFNTNVIPNANQGFNGTKTCQTDNLGQTTVARLESPWVNLSVGELKFDHAVPSFNGNRQLKVYSVNVSLNETLLFTHTYTNSSAVNTTLNNTITGVHKIRFVWTSSGGNSKGQIDNIVIPGVNVSDPSNNCDSYVPPVDTTFINYYPASDTSTLVFEDLWPNYGDYDMNDLVIGYKFKIVSYTINQVTDIYCTFIVRASGAGLQNGFGFQLPIDATDIINVNGVGDQDGYNISSNGTEIGNTMSTFIIYDDQHKFMSEWNTIKNGGICPQKTFNIHIQITPQTVSLQDLSIQDWNPFIVVGGIRGHEIHLSDYEPTTLMDLSIFGTGNDDSQPLQGKYYKSSTNLPWSLDIYGTFNYPSEKSDISDSYLHFQDWVLSGGVSFTDWWLNTSNGYRNNDLIY